MTAFYVANGKKPVSIPQTYLSLPEKPTTQTIKVGAKSLVTYLMKKTKIGIKSVKNSHDIEKKCFNHPKCGLILHHGNLTSQQRSIVFSTTQSHRLLNWVVLDVSTHSFSLQSKLPSVSEGNPALVVFKTSKPNKKTGKKLAVKTKGIDGTVSIKSYRGVFEQAHITTFIEKLFENESKMEMT